jgi:uncharacterized protein (DUF1501 family)
MFGVGLAPAWLSRAAYAGDLPVSGRKKILVAVFQRGAADGLNVVVPFGDPDYYALRPTIGIPKPDGTTNATLDLDGFFGLHPALAPLVPVFQTGELAIVEAAGSPDPTRSHFDAQDYMESGTPGIKATNDGWLNRSLRPEQQPSPVRAISIGSDLARSLRGPNDAVAIANIGDFQIRDAGTQNTFEAMYGESVDTVLHGPAQETFEAVKLIQAVQKQKYTPFGGARYPGGPFGQAMLQVARLIKANVGVEVAFADVGGWDTHVNEVGGKPTEGQLTNRLTEFGQALAAFYQDMGDRMADIVVVTMSEFGRTARENGDRGTDHGHANVMFAMGGGIRGGKVYGDWPGLAHERLYEGRDLALTTDFRDVLGECVTKHLKGRSVAEVFPGYNQPRYRGLLA